MVLLAHHARSMFGLEIEINDQPFPDGPTEHAIVFGVLALVLVLSSYGAYALIRDVLRCAGRRCAEGFCLSACGLGSRSKMAGPVSRRACPGGDKPRRSPDQAIIRDRLSGKCQTKYPRSQGRSAMKRLLLLVSLFWLLPAPLAVAADDEDAKLAAYFKSYLEEEFRHRPLTATRLGDHRFDSPARRHLAEGPRRRHRAHAQGAGRTAGEDRLQQADALRPDRLRNLQARADARALAGRERQAVRGRSARLQRVHHRERLFAADAIDAAEGDQRHELRGAHGRRFRRSSRRRKESLASPPRVFVETAIRQNRGRHRLLRERHLRARRRDAAAQRTAARRPGRSWRRSRNIRSSWRRSCCRGPRATGGSARRSSPGSWNWNSTPA